MRVLWRRTCACLLSIAIVPGLSAYALEGFSGGVFSVVLLVVCLLLFGIQMRLLLKASHLDLYFEQSIRLRLPDWVTSKVSMTERVEHLAKWSKWWHLEYVNASQRLAKFYAREFNTKPSSQAQEALLFEFELARKSMIESVFGDGLELAKMRTGDIGSWIQNFSKPLSQDEVDSLTQSIDQ